MPQDCRLLIRNSSQDLKLLQLSHDAIRRRWAETVLPLGKVLTLLDLVQGGIRSEGERREAITTLARKRSRSAEWWEASEKGGRRIPAFPSLLSTASLN